MVWTDLSIFPDVSILVLMELCIKTWKAEEEFHRLVGFNPCFNGTMYKNKLDKKRAQVLSIVSILVLMELCIKTLLAKVKMVHMLSFQSLF